MTFKPQFIYVFKLKGRHDVFEGIHCFTMHGTAIWKSLPFSASEPCLRFTLLNRIDWAEEVCQMTASMTEYMYHDALALLPP